MFLVQMLEPPHVHKSTSRLNFGTFSLAVWLKLNRVDRWGHQNCLKALRSNPNCFDNFEKMPDWLGSRQYDFRTSNYFLVD